MRFIADEMLGKLARWLRMAGLDVAYQRSIGDEQLLHRAGEEERILLTRDTRLIRRCPEPRYFFITQDHLPEQLRELFRHFPELKGQLSPLSRCVECNQPLVPIPRDQVRGKVWPYVYETQENFTTCPECHRIFWEATHVARIKEKLRRLLP
ncbi:MAG: Mut7-C RNAse domain-containing protein [bacterium]